MKRMRVRVSACVVLGFLAFTAGADGGYFSVPAAVSVAVSADQRAIIVRNGNTTTMTLSTAYTGDGEDFAWIIPTPAAPAEGDVTQAGERAEKAFEILDTITSPKIRIEDPMGVVVGGVRGGAVREAPQVQVRARFLLASYEVSILKATASSGLVQWLRDNGYAVSGKAGSVLGQYVARRWAFTAIKLRPSEQRRYNSEFLPPITIRYRSGQFVFPLRISAVSTVHPAKITLYVIAGSTVSCSNLVTFPVSPAAAGSYQDPESAVEAAIARSTGSDGKAVALLWSGQYQVDLYDRARRDLEALLVSNAFEIGKIAWVEEDTDEQTMTNEDTFFRSLKDEVFLGDPFCLTRLEARISPSAMTKDIVFAEDETPREFSVEGHRPRKPQGAR
jgi:hypothetical protein